MSTFTGTDLIGRWKWSSVQSWYTLGHSKGHDGVVQGPPSVSQVSHKVRSGSLRVQPRLARSQWDRACDLPIGLLEDIAGAINDEVPVAMDSPCVDSVAPTRPYPASPPPHPPTSASVATAAAAAIHAHRIHMQLRLRAHLCLRSRMRCLLQLHIRLRMRSRSR